MNSALTTPAAPPQAQRAVITDGRPLCSVEAATFILGADAETIERHAQSGKLVAFDIAMPGSSRAALRLYTCSVLALKNGVEFVVRLPDRKIAELIFPPSRPTFALARAAWLLHCGPSHVARLLQSGQVQETGRGAHHQRNISGPSLAAWLASRRFS